MKLVHFYQKLTLTEKNGTKYTLISTSRKPNQIGMGHTNNYSKATTPSTTEITIQNITPAHQKRFKKGLEVDLEAGWFNADASTKVVHTTTSGTISSMTPPSEGDDANTLTFNVKDGKDYDNIKTIKIKKSKTVRKQASQKELTKAIKAYSTKLDNQFASWKKANPKATKTQVATKQSALAKKQKTYTTNARSAYNKAKKYYDKHKKTEQKTVYEYMSFKKNTKASTIIKSIAKKAGIKIKTLDLSTDHVFLKGYTAKSKPMTCIREIAKTCVTDVTWPHGELVIKNIKSGHKIDLHIEASTGILAKAVRQTDGGGKQWQLQFLYRSITVGDVFYYKDPDSTRLKGWVIVLSGTNAVEIGDVPTSAPLVELYDDYKKEQAKKINAQKKKDRKTKSKADAAAKKKARAKRATRTKSKQSKDKKSTTKKSTSSKSDKKS